MASADNWTGTSDGWAHPTPDNGADTYGNVDWGDGGGGASADSYVPLHESKVSS